MTDHPQRGLDFGAGAAPAPPRRSLTVSQLTERVQGVLQTEFFDVWVEGEVSNLTFPASGHWYFSLKDERAQIKAVVWKTQARLVRFRPQEGMKVVVRASLRVYPPKGEYQLQVEVVEPLGKGALQQAFEDLKQRLSKEGLFDPARKRPLPMLPRSIGLVTSPTGAAVQDFLRVLGSRYPNAEVLVYPARVQGAEAAGEIVQGIRALNRFQRLGVLVVARGGGSLEDLWPFNEESVARALAASRLPTISAVGHETDYTIADFVADARAPTPSAAALMVAQAKDDVCARLEALGGRAEAALRLRLSTVRARVGALTSHRVFEAERGRLRGHGLVVRELERRSEAALRARLERGRERLRRGTERVEAFRWDRQVAQRRERVDGHRRRLVELVGGRLRDRRQALRALAGRLQGLSPLAVLSRGYALVWDGGGALVRHPDEVAVGDLLRIRVAGGDLAATVTGKPEGA
jgi:exodeoxyribonuclease VII large subunit